MVDSADTIRASAPRARSRTDRPSWVTVASGRAVLDEFGEALDGLHRAAGAPVTVRRPWISAWVDTFRSWEPWGVLVHSADSGELDAAALLAARSRLGVTEIVGLGHGPSDYLRLPARDAGAAVRLGEQLAAELRALRGPWRLEIEQLPVGDPAAGAVARSLRHSLLRPGDASPATVFDNGRDLNAYTSRNFRSQVRRKRQRLAEAAGGVDVRFDRDPSAVAALQPQLEAIRLERDRDQGRLGDLDTKEGSAFWWSALPRLAADGELEVATLWAGDDVAAYVVALLDGSAYRSWDPRMNPRWSAYSPGLVLDFAVLERLLADARFDVFDRMRGEEPYKLRTANVSVPAERLTVWSSAALRRLDLGIAGFKARVRRAEGVMRVWRLARRRTRGQLPRSPETEE